MTESLLRITPHLSIPLSELTFRTARSGGPGGQHVNKVETKVEIAFDVRNSHSLSISERQLIFEALGNRIDSDGVLKIAVQQSRSQFQNKQIALERFVGLLKSALKPKAVRIPTKPSKSVREQRLRAKKKRSEKKSMRRLSRDDH